MRRFQVPVAVCSSLVASCGALAAPVSIHVVGQDGQPVAGAVVTITMPGTRPPVPRGAYVMAQRNITFDPHILIVPVGATVAFPNFDKVRHHVYSFSRTKRFDLKLFGRDESRSITFDKAGAVLLGCNIHDAMNGVIYVTASPYTAVTGADGRVALNVGSAGGATVAVWHPSIRQPENTVLQPLSVTPSGVATTLKLRG